MRKTCTHIATYEIGAELGEGVLWDARNDRVWWTDIEGRMLYRRQFPDGEIECFKLPERLCSFGLLESEDEVIVGAFAPGFAFYDLRSDALYWLAKPLAPPYIRFNDGRVDRNGVFWAGSMIEGDAPPAGNRAALYRLDDHDAAVRMFSGIEISNSLCWSPDGDITYFADSVARTIWAFDYVYGRLENRRVFATTADGVGPDGSTVDAEGYLWNAEWGASRVVRYTPDGRVDFTLSIPAPNVSCVAFGGPNLSQLFVTTARQHMTEEALAAAPLSGAVFVYDTPYRGIAENRCHLLPKAA